MRELTATINKNLRNLGKTPVRIQGPKPTSGSVKYRAGRGYEGSSFYDTKEEAIRASKPKGAEDDYKLTESVSLAKGETKYKVDGPAYRSVVRAWSLMRDARSQILQGKAPRYKVFPQFESLLQGLSRDDKVKKIYDLRKELLENPRAFQEKYNIRSRSGIWPEENMLGESKQINTATTQREAVKDTGFYLSEVDAPKNPVVVSPDDPEAIKAAAKKQAEQNKKGKDAYRQLLDIGAITRKEYDERVAGLADRKPEALWEQEIINQGLEIPRGAKTPYEAASHPDNIPNLKGRTALQQGTETRFFQPKLGYPSKSEPITSVIDDGLHRMHQRFEDTHIIPDEDGSLTADFTGSVFKNVDGTKVTDWSKVRFGGHKNPDVADLRGLTLSREGAKSFKEHRKDYIHLLSKETRDKYSEIFGDYLNRQ